jgi:hypothetical protein
MDEKNNLDSDDVEILSVLDTQAIELHEMFLALKRAGFEHKDAVTMVAHAVAMGVIGPVHFSHVDNNDDFDDFGDASPF